MKIGIDIRTACDSTRAGKGWYTAHLVEHLLNIDTKNEYWLYANTDTNPFKNRKNATVKIFRKKPWIWHWSVVKDFSKSGGDVFFAPTSFIIPSLLPQNIRSVMTVHDLVSFLFPLRHQAKAVMLENFFLKKALRKTSMVLAPSENTKRDLQKLFYVAEDKIKVTPLAAGEIFSKEPKGLQAFREKWNLPEKFLLSVGTLEPRKNLAMLLEAAEEIFKTDDELAVIIVGKEGWQSKDIFSMMKKMKHRVVFLPYLSEEDLAKIYRLATAFIFPSLYEGFGIPPLEAMASGCPVISSNAGSLPEVVGDAALPFDPRDKKALITQLERILKNPDLRQEIVRRGKEQAAKFSWKKTAQQTLEVLNGFRKGIVAA